MTTFDPEIDDDPLEADDPSICPQCGAERERVECDQCEDGIIDAETLMMEDPMWYDEDSWEYCGQCGGKGGWWICWHCQEQAKKEEEDKSSA